jgi:hypothetical protein
MAHGDARAEKWSGDKRTEWVTNKRHMTGEHRLARAIQTVQADVYSSPASSRLIWLPPPPYPYLFPPPLTTPQHSPLTPPPPAADLNELVRFA